MTSETDRNPSPPPELFQNDKDFLPDRIGDSVYSKHWLLQVLKKIMETANQDEKINPSAVSSESDSSTKSNDIVELDSKIEESACVLWDMSANIAVANFLHEFHAVEIFIEVIDKTRSPRLLEIIIGIIANMASFNDLCLDLSRNVPLLNTIVSLTGTSDAPTIVQVLRLIQTGVVNKTTRNLWMVCLLGNSFFMEKMKFILENSLNGDILEAALQLMYYIFDEDEMACLAWSNEEHANALVTAGTQLMFLGDQKNLDKYWLVLNVLCQYEPNSKSLAQKYRYLCNIFSSYITIFGDQEAILLPASRVLAVAACYSTYAILLKLAELDAEMVENEFAHVGLLHKIFFSVCDIVSKMTKSEELTGQNVNSPQSSDEWETDIRQASKDCSKDDKILNGGQENEHHNWIILQKSIVDTATILKSFLDEGDMRESLLSDITEVEMEATQ